MITCLITYVHDLYMTSFMITFDIQDSTGQDVAMAGHKHIQQQMLVHVNGMTVQVVKMVQLGGGNGGPIDLQGHLAALASGGIQIDVGGQDVQDQIRQITEHIEKGDNAISAGDVGQDKRGEESDTIRIEQVDQQMMNEVGESAHENVTAIVHTKTYAIPTTKPSIKTKEEAKSPPDSMFRKLFPSDTRYTLLKKDEL